MPANSNNDNVLTSFEDNQGVEHDLKVHFQETVFEDMEEAAGRMVLVRSVERELDHVELDGEIVDHYEVIRAYPQAEKAIDEVLEGDD